MFKRTRYFKNTGCKRVWVFIVIQCIVDGDIESNDRKIKLGGTPLPEMQYGCVGFSNLCLMFNLQISMAQELGVFYVYFTPGSQSQ